MRILRQRTTTVWLKYPDQHLENGAAMTLEKIVSGFGPTKDARAVKEPPLSGTRHATKPIDVLARRPEASVPANRRAVAILMFYSASPFPP